MVAEQPTIIILISIHSTTRVETDKQYIYQVSF